MTEKTLFQCNTLDCENQFYLPPPTPKTSTPNPAAISNAANAGRIMDLRC